MYKPILYLDCDGVIFNTIQEAYKMMQELHMDINDSEMVHSFFVCVDWNILIYRAGILKNAIIKIKNIIASEEYQEVVIVTKISGNCEEEKIKRIIFGKLLPDVKVVTLDLQENKEEVVDPVNNILIDDDRNNVLRFTNACGVGVLFVHDNPRYELNEIADLEDIKEASGVKKLFKTRNI